MKLIKHLLLTIIVMCTQSFGDLSITSDTTYWVPVTYGTNTPDAFADQQTGLVSGDLVGDENHAAFYTQFDDAGTADLTDGTIAFRARINSVKNESKMDFDYNLFVGMDANLDGALDLFLGIDNNPNGTGQLAIWFPGNGANTGPSTTTIVSPPTLTFDEVIGVNYYFTLIGAEIDPNASSYDVDGGGSTDAFISFSFNFNDIVSVLSSNGISIDQSTPINYVMATATQNNSLNMDLNGVNGGTDSTLTFSELGATSDTFSPDGVPEPAVVALLGTGGLVLMISRRMKQSKDRSLQQ
ncbi:PEP-CTERM sorting domain-containing protein [Tichowtungia aerotolerans]|uniref:PEP-CTERM sorting domain-containing protein n=1 Tax=Tichowtungia aerotolerans TaxID=2697043 RepID=A0A6P1MGU5_9BACT|nr:PEP-CTERM sorting domain-containing protein [Tichowtungia aerotolerans]QHI70305.1 PEP-CTERM sorting domain-containing protein [Tichowtungia aerotolerans]